MLEEARSTLVVVKEEDGFGSKQLLVIEKWSEEEQSEDPPEWPSMVAIIGPLEKYTEEELGIVLDFAEAKTDEYVRRNGKRPIGAHFFIIGKASNRPTGTKWVGKQVFSNTGQCFFPGLDQVIAHLKDR